jgi:hypothetical protein
VRTLPTASGSAPWKDLASETNGFISERPVILLLLACLDARIAEDAAWMEHANRSRAKMVYMDKGRQPKVIRTWMTDKIRKAMSAQRRAPAVPRKPEPHNNT